MAEAGAHVTWSSVDHRPSIFEVLAQESLMEAVKPALRHAVKVLAESDPSRCGFLWRYFDELYLVLDLLLQNHFLSRFGASFSENFYGLKRVSGSDPGPVPPGLRGSARRRSLLVLCLVPYVRAKLEAALARHRDEEDFSIRLARSPAHRMYRAAVAAYPYLDSAWRVLVFCQQVLFVFGTTRTHSPLLWLSRVHLTRLHAHDLRHMDAKREEPHGSLVQGAWSLMSRLARGVAVSLSASLSVGVFFLQFLDWWYSSDNQTAVRTLTSLPAPPPPLHLQPDRLCPASANRSGAAPGPASERARSVRACPLCGRPWSNPAVLSTSGLVFCYRCVYTYVKAQRRCPVTGYPTELTHLIKIYAPDT